jgi:hypothetical protein
VLVRPTQIHAQQHGRPVLRFRAACAGVDFKYGGQMIFLFRKQHIHFRLLKKIA